MTNTKTPPGAGASASQPRRAKARKYDSLGARALVAALAVGATLGGWAIIAQDSTATAVAEPLASPTTVVTQDGSDIQLAPLPTVIAPPAGIDQAANTRLAPLDAPLLRQAPLSSAAQTLRLRPLTRSRSSN